MIVIILLTIIIILVLLKFKNDIENDNNEINKNMTPHNSNYSSEYNEKIIFHYMPTHGVSFRKIKDDLYYIFSSQEYDKIFSKDFVGVISGYYYNENKKIIVNKDENNCSITIYYVEGNPMFEYQRANQSTIFFTHYSSNGETFSSKTYNLENFSIFLNSLPRNMNISRDILLFYRILGVDSLIPLIYLDQNHILFHKDIDSPVTIVGIKKNILDIFDGDNDKFNKICYANYTGIISGLYKSKSKKITIITNSNHLTLDIFYKNGNIMFEYKRLHNFNIVLNRYSFNGKILSSENYTFDDFSLLLEFLPEKNTIIVDFLILYRMLNTDNLEYLIKNNNEYENDETVTSKEIRKDLFRIFNQIRDKLNNIYDKNHHETVYTSYRKDRRKMEVTSGTDSYDISIYYENSNPMFEYKRCNYSIISFNQYNHNGELISSQTYDFNELLLSLEAPPVYSSVPQDILLLYKILNTHCLYDLIASNNEHILFYTKEGESITQKRIITDFYPQFDRYETSRVNLFNKSVYGVFSGSYENGNKKIVLSRNFSSYKIDIYYRNGNLMFEYHSFVKTDITFNHYCFNGEILSSKNCTFDDFSDLLSHLSLVGVLFRDIVLLYKILDTNSLDNLIMENNENIFFSHYFGCYAISLHPRIEFYLDFGRDDDDFSKICDVDYIGSIPNYYENNTKRIVVNKNKDNCDIDIYYENGSLMYQYKKSNNYTIIFNQYSFNGEIVFSKSYIFDEFSSILDSVPQRDTFPRDILILYKILSLTEILFFTQLNNLIKRNNEYLLGTSPMQEKIIKKADEDTQICTQSTNEKSSDDDKDIENSSKWKDSTENLEVKEFYYTNSESSIIKDGPFRLYYENNAIKSIGTYKNGKLEGPYTEYHPNGRVKIDGYYENGDKKRIWKFFSDSGKLEREEGY